jgi:hypothetical protein
MTTRFKIPNNFDKQIVAQIILVVLFLLACFWIAAQPNPFEANEAPPPPKNEQVSPPNPTQLAFNATEVQLEIEENRDQTIGVVFGGTMLVVLIVGGTLLAMNRR